ncbi:MAG: class I SAM-dependent methyltransferase [Candidatus Bruticola sp.]
MPLFKHSKNSRNARSRRGEHGSSRDSRFTPKSAEKSNYTKRERFVRSAEEKIINPEYADPAELVEAARKERRRQRALKEAQAPVSPEQEAALKSISLFLDNYADLFVDCQNWLFMRAHFTPELFYSDPASGLGRFAFSPGGKITCEQSSARAYRRLAGHTLAPKDRVHRQTANCLLFVGYPSEETPEVGLVQPWDNEGEYKLVYDAALILGTSSRAENYVNFVRALRSVRSGGLILFSIANTLGAGSFEKAMSEYTPLAAQQSKYHCRTFAIRVPENIAAEERMAELMQKWEEGFNYRICTDSGLLSRPGIFSWNKADGGSKLLADYIKNKAQLRGVGADLGSANGFLTKAALESRSCQAGEISRIDLFEDEYLSLAAAKALLKDKNPKVRIGYSWADVISDVPHEQYDWIVMNPPFHQGQTRVLNLGREFVASAARALTWRGVLYVVVNRTLPYEDTLAEYFKNYEKVAENNSFKVFVASEPLSSVGNAEYRCRKA